MIMNVDFVWWLITTLLIAGMAGWNYKEAKRYEVLYQEALRECKSCLNTIELYDRILDIRNEEKEELEAMLHKRRGKYD